MFRGRCHSLSALPVGVSQHKRVNMAYVLHLLTTLQKLSLSSFVIDRFRTSYGCTAVDTVQQSAPQTYYTTQVEVCLNRALPSGCCQAWYDQLEFSWTQAVYYTASCGLFRAQTQRIHQTSSKLESFAYKRSCHLRGCIAIESKGRKLDTKQQAKSGSEESRTRQLLRT